MPRSAPSAFRRPAVPALLLLLFVLGCSHTTPFYRAGLTPGGAEPGGAELAYRVLLIGDAGEPLPGEPVLDSLEDTARRDPDRTAIVFLGDNIYPLGMVPERMAEARSRIDPQIAAVVGSGARGLFIPGNHDWAKGRIGGRRALATQQAYVEQRVANPDPFLPRNGCPGPEILDLPVDRPAVRIVVLDTQWWLSNHREPGPPCDNTTEDAVLAELALALTTPLPTVVVAHHPLSTAGPHGGFFTWKDHLFPLTNLEPNAWIPFPGLGSLYPLYRGTSPNRQDIEEDVYARMIRRISGELGRRRPVAYASGHDHSLQVLDGAGIADVLLVSGAGSEAKLTQVGDLPGTRFAHHHTGFMALEFLTDGSVWLRVLEPGASCWPDGACEVYTERLRGPRRTAAE